MSPFQSVQDWDSWQEENAWGKALTGLHFIFRDTCQTSELEESKYPSIAHWCHFAKEQRWVLGQLEHMEFTSLRNRENSGPRGPYGVFL